MGRFLLDVLFGFAFVAIGILVVFVLLPSGKLDLANAFFSILFGVFFGVPLGIAYAFIRVVVRRAVA